MTNILSNAFKFTPEGGQILVSIKESQTNNVISKESSTEKSLLYGNKISPFGRNDNEGVVEIKVKDTGIGISEEELPKLFDRFYQVDSSQTREHEGTGIGLALTKELVELHQGTISVDSKPEESGSHGTGWTEFTIELPLGRNHLKDYEIFVNERPAIDPEILD